ncbi:MAG: bifunctional lysylphosphatidylglycerol flippase/synthetase MprF, partial [Desulfomonilia bacterium]
FINRPLGFRKMATASFIGYAFSNNIGFSMVAGASIRYRLYSSWGLSALEITKVIFFNTVSIWLGFLMLGAGVFLLEPLDIPKALHIPFATDRPLGLLFLIPILTYAALILTKRRALKFGDLEMTVPPARLFLPQIAVATIDWAFAGSILFVLLPPTIPLPSFIGIYLIAQLAGLVSQIPGGLGIFEAVILIFLSPLIPASSIIGSLVIYRLTYYILPLLIAAIILGIEEIIQRKQILQWGAQTLTRWLPYMVPPVLTVITFLSGVIMLFSGATPAISYRLEQLSVYVPLPVVEVSHFLGSIFGVGLLILARGLQRRLDTAYYMTVALVVAGIILSLLKGLEYEEASVLLVMLFILIPSKPSFYRKGSLFGGRFTAGWLLVMGIVLLSTAWLTYFSYKHVEYSTDLWWRFAFMASAPRSLRAAVGALVAALVYSFAKILHPISPRPVTGSTGDIEKALPVINASPESYANLALLGDKALLFSENGKAFIMYTISGRSWIAMGDPIGLKSEWQELAWQYCELCDRFGGWPVFYEVGSHNLHVYIDLGMTLVKLGEEGRVELDTFSLDGGSRKELRHTYNKLTKEGYTFDVVQPHSVPKIIGDLRRVSDAWLEEKKTKEKGFSLGFFKEDYIARFPIGLIRRGDEIIAFSNLWTSGEMEEISIDLMRYMPDAPSGTMDYLFINLILWGKGNRYHWFNLGMAPLSGHSDKSLTSMWNRKGGFLFRHVENFYNFQGLRQYKEKFQPQWRPRYLASPTTLSLPVVLTNIATLTSGGAKGIVSK